MEKLHVNIGDGNNRAYTGEGTINPIFDPRKQHTNFLLSTFGRLYALDKNEKTSLVGADWTLFGAVAEELELRDVLPVNWFYHYAIDTNRSPD